MNLYTGCVESRDDPLKIGRCQVRIVGLHSENKIELPTKDLPWAHPMQSINSASMNGIGWTPVGPVEGSWVIIMFTDDDQQQPIMMGTIGGIPQSKSASIAIDESDGNVIATNSGILTDTSGSPITAVDGSTVSVGTVEAQSSPNPNAPISSTSTSENINEQKVPNKPSDSSLNKPIPSDPPSNSTNFPNISKQNIQYIISACDTLGLTSKYAKCSILAICGGESAWLCIEENSYYITAESLVNTFKKSFPNGVTEAEPYIKWKGTKEDFFRKIYSPEGSGSMVGNTNPDDGALYYGRGFNQITGKSTYTQLQNYLQQNNIVIDLVLNPSILITNPELSALATVAFYAINISNDIEDPSYFISALKRTGSDSSGTSYKKKQQYYEYFLGESISLDSTNKPTADAQKTYSKEDVSSFSPSKQSALLEDRSSNSTIGFSDPTGKYPLRNLMDEPDTNRLARGVQKETAIEFKDSSRTKQIPMANDTTTWEQPLSPFGGVYPYSKVMESESGHLLVYDDTPLNENISFYHKTGSFIDIDAHGTQVNKIIGDGYQIIDRNGSIHIAGKANLTVGNGINILVQGNADIQVDGESTINLNNNADIGVAGTLNLAIGGDFNIDVTGSIGIKSGNTFSIDSDMTTSINSTIATAIKSDGIVSADGSFFFGQSGLSSAVPGFTQAITPPNRTTPRINQFDYLTTPVRPSPSVELDPATAIENEAMVADYLNNPNNYKNNDASNGGVKGNYAGTPKDGIVGQSLISGAAISNIKTFLDTQLHLASGGYWKETGQGKNPSNQNIIRIWTDLGYPSSGMWKTDQTVWCMGFVNWTLKQCGYRYTSRADARSIINNTSDWKAVNIVNLSDALPGDIALWNYNHVNFVYSNINNKLSFVGGNQSPVGGKNSPSDGDLTQTWKGGYVPPGNGSLVAIFRPSSV